MTFKGTAFLTDFVFSNPRGQEGALVVLRNNVQLVRLRLENFRDYDLHFVTPHRLLARRPAQPVARLRGRAEPCDPAVLYSGYLRP